MSEISVAYSPR